MNTEIDEAKAASGCPEDFGLVEWLDELKSRAGCSIESAIEKRDAALAELEREREYRQRLPADWFEDSSLETWFPITAEELATLRADLERVHSESTAKVVAQHEELARLRSELAESQRKLAEHEFALQEAASDHNRLERQLDASLRREGKTQEHALKLQDALREGIALMPLDRIPKWKCVTVQLLDEMAAYEESALGAGSEEVSS